MQKSQTHLSSLLGLILFALSGLFLLGVGLFMAVAAFSGWVTGRSIQAQQMIFFLAFCFEAVLLFVIAFFALQKTLQKPSADRASFVSVTRLQILIGMVIAASAILVGSLLSENETINWLVLPILTIPGIVLPLTVLLALGTQRLPLGTRWESWSVLGLGMTLAPLLLLILEAVIAIILFVILAIYVSIQPELVTEFQRIMDQIIIFGPDSKATQDLLSPYLTKPGVIVLALLYIAVLVPAIEELLKPLGVWLLARKLDTPAQGFTLGALSGAGYALIETIGVSGQVSGWATLLSTRIGTGLLHITTSALVGAAIVTAWRERRVLRLLGIYFLAVLLHGLWNACAMLFTFSTLAESLDQPGLLRTIQPGIIATMSILAVTLFVILILSNRRLRRTTIPPEPEPTIPEPQIDPSV